VVGGHDGYGIGEGVITSIPFRRISQQILKQELQLYEIYQAQIASCDVEIDKCLASFDCQLIQVQITMNRNIGNESFLSWRKRLNLWAFIWLLNLKTQFEFLRRTLAMTQGFESLAGGRTVQHVAQIERWRHPDA
jgi:hypothetical protein